VGSSCPVALHDKPVARPAGGTEVWPSPDGSDVTEKSRLLRYVVSRSAASGDRRLEADRFELLRLADCFDLAVCAGDVGVRVFGLLRAGFATRFAYPDGAGRRPRAGTSLVSVSRRRPDTGMDGRVGGGRRRSGPPGAGVEEAGHRCG
jgi:hypothetical protein